MPVAKSNEEVRMETEKMKAANISRQAAHHMATELIVKFVEKAPLPTGEGNESEDLDPLNQYLSWCVDKICEIGSIIAQNILGEAEGPEEFPPPPANPPVQQ